MVEGTLGIVDAGAFFRSNLRGSIPDFTALDYVVSMMIDFMQPGKLETLKSEKPYPVLIDDLMTSNEKAKSYDRLKDLGDTCLWLCGFFPEHLSKKRKSKLGLAWSVERGREAYNFAIYIANSERLKGLPIKSLSIVSDYFPVCARAILELKVRVNKFPALPPPDVAEEIGRVLYGRSGISVYLARIAGQERPELRVVENIRNEIN